MRTSDRTWYRPVFMKTHCRPRICLEAPPLFPREQTPRGRGGHDAGWQSAASPSEALGARDYVTVFHAFIERRLVNV